MSKLVGLRSRRLRLPLVLVLAAGAAAWWYARPRFVPQVIVIHHSDTGAVGDDGRRVDAALIDSWHAQRGFRAFSHWHVYHIGYHYVILPDGTVQPGRPEDCQGAHALGANANSLGICLIGDFDTPGGAGPTDAQMRSLTALCAHLMGKYHISAQNVRRHCDVSPPGHTVCPGRRFPWEQFQVALARRAHDLPLAGVLRRAGRRTAARSAGRPGTTGPLCARGAP